MRDNLLRRSAPSSVGRRAPSRLCPLSRVPRSCGPPSSSAAAGGAPLAARGWGLCPLPRCACARLPPPRPAFSPPAPFFGARVAAVPRARAGAPPLPPSWRGPLPRRFPRARLCASAARLLGLRHSRAGALPAGCGGPPPPRVSFPPRVRPRSASAIVGESPHTPRTRAPIRYPRGDQSR